MSNASHPQNATSRLSWADSLLALLIALTPIQPAHGEPPDILIITSSASELYQRFETTLRTELPGSGNPEDAAIIRTINLAGKQLSPASIPAGSDLLVTIGSHAARSVAGLDTAVPVLHTVIPISVYQSIAAPQRDCRLQSAIFIDQPVSRQLRLAGIMFPELKNYGLLLGPVSVKRRNEIEAAELSNGVRLAVSVVGEDDSSMTAGRQILGDSDLIIAVNDPIALSRENAKWLLYVAYQQRKPVIGFSRAYVKAGASAAVYSSPEQMALHAAEVVSSWRTTTTRCLLEPQFTRNFSIAVNRAVSDSLGSATLDEDELARRILEAEQP